jgi:phage-related protein
VVRDWLRELGETDRNVFGQDLMRVQYRWPVGMPLCRAIGDGLSEVRTDLKSNRMARVLFSFRRGKLLALHGLSRRAKRRRMRIWDSPASVCANLAHEAMYEKKEGDER